MKKFKVSHEVPKTLLRQSLAFNSYQYCLPHLIEQDEEYRNFFLECKKDGVEIYLDNSLHELGASVSDELLLKWVNILEPTTFFVPDVWQDRDASVVNAKRWSNIKVPDKTTKTAVVQAKNITEAITCVQTYKDLGYKKIAFSYGNELYNELIPHPNKDMGKALGRVALISYLYNKKILLPSDRVHLLGTAIPQEFSWYNGIECIESLDTSNPIMAALDGTSYEVYGLNNKPKSNLNSSFLATNFDRSLILTNIVKFNNLIPDRILKTTPQVQLNSNPNKFLSIFEYSGRPIGIGLGGFIYKKSRHQGIKIETKDISAKNYQGRIIMYPESWLKENLDKLIKEYTVSLNQEDNDDLPF
jgi:hypothetical protein